MIDRSLKALLDLYDAVGKVLLRHEMKGAALYERIYGDVEPDARGCILVSGFDRPEGTPYCFTVYRFGWSHHSMKLVKSCSHDSSDGPHSEATLKRYNPDDFRLKTAPPEPSGDMEKIAWLPAERAHKKGLKQAWTKWEGEWQKKLGFDQALITDFVAYTARQRQLWYRRGFLLGKMATIIRSHLHEEGNDLYQIRNGPSSYSDQVGPDIAIEGRTFYFEGESLREGKPWPTFDFSLSTAEVERERHGWWPESNNYKTRELRNYLARKTRLKRESSPFDGQEDEG